MAKRARKATEGTARDGRGGQTAESGESAQSRIVDFAEDLGRFLGTTQAKASAWMDQRTALLEQLTKVRDTAVHYIEQLGGTAASALPRRRGMRRAKSPAGSPGGTVKKKRTMSAEARAKIAAAQRARWAKQKAAGR